MTEQIAELPAVQAFLREMYLARRRGLIVELEAIEKAFPTQTVTVTLKREDAIRLGLLK